MSNHETPNHDYNVPDKGTLDWHEPVNENFEAFDADIEIRDTGAPDTNGYTPADGAKYLDTDTGTVYLGDGSSWTEAFSFGGGGGGSGIESLSGGEGIDPSDIGDGDTLSVVWGDADALGSAGALATDSVGSDEVQSGAVESDALAAQVAVDELDVGTLTGPLTGGVTLSDIAGDNLSIDNGTLNASGSGGSTSLSGGEGIDPGSITDGDTLSVAWGDASVLDTAGAIADWSGAADLDASGNVTASFIAGLSGGEGIDPSSIGDGDTLSVAWGDGAGLDSTGTPDDFGNASDLTLAGSIDTVSGALTPPGVTLTDIAGNNLFINNGTLNASGSSTSLSGGEGIDPGSITDGDTLSAAWEDAGALDTNGNVSDWSGAADLDTSGAITDWSGAADLDTSGAIADWSGAADLDVSGAITDWSGAAVLDASGAIADWSGAADLDASGSVTASFIAGLSGGDGIDPASIGDGDTVSVAWEDANDLDQDGNVTSGGGGIQSLTGGDGINPGSIGDGDTLSAAWEDAGALDGAGDVAAGAIGATELAQAGASDGHVFRWNGSTSAWETGVPGTTTATPLELQVDGSRALELGVPDSDGLREAGGNVVAGHPSNTVNNSAVGVVIGGGGAADGNENTVGGNYATVSGGLNNTASGKDGTVGGGRSNMASEDYATVGGGRSNTASSFHATVGGGLENTASSFRATVGGGDGNTASGYASTVPGGRRGAAESSGSFVWNDGATYHAIPNSDSDGLSSDTAVDGEPVTGADTFSVSATSGFRFITGGSSSPRVTYVDSDGTLSVGGATVQSQSGDALSFNTDGGRQTLKLGVPDSDGFREAGGNVVAGHPNNTVNDSAVGAVIGGGGAADGNENTVGGNYATVGGGRENTASENYATVGGGKSNTASGGSATVGGGNSNTASALDATVGGGVLNTASGLRATVGGGLENTASGNGSTVPGGRRGAAKSTKSFVWNDATGYHDIPNTNNDGLSSDTPVDGEPVTGQNTFSVSATSGFRFITGSASNPNVTYIPGSSAGWTTTSSRAVKTNIDPVDPQEALDGVESMEVATWEYESEDGDGAGTTHIGPMAGDFHDAFDVGTSDEHINSINADGVALAAIQGLSAELDEARAELAETREDLEAETEQLHEENERLRAENEQLREENEALRERVAAIETELGLDGEQAVADD
jgi:FtsZ-binding cell division protein ZapB